MLIAEDEGLIRMHLARALERLGCSVHECATGDEALASLGEELDVVIADYNMPGANGIEVLQAAAGRCPRARLVCTSGQPVELPCDLAERGAVVVGKPFRLSHLIELIRASRG